MNFNTPLLDAGRAEASGGAVRLFQLEGNRLGQYQLAEISEAAPLPACDVTRRSCAADDQPDRPAVGKKN